MKTIASARNRYRILSAVLLLLTGVVSPVYADSLIRGPYLQMGTPDSMTIRWRTDVESSSTVQYGADLSNFPTGSVTDTDPDPIPDPDIPEKTDYDYEVTLKGLSPSTKYYYSVQDSSGGDLSGPDNDHFFITSPPVGTNNLTRAWIIGDSGTANANAAAVYNAFRSRAGPNYTDLWIMLGDNAYNDGTDRQYQAAVFDMYPELLKQSPLWSTLGNHDGYSADSGAQAGPYYDIFTLPTAAEAGGVASGTEAYYSFDYGQIHFVCLDSYDTSRALGGPMLTWLENDLQATEQKWIVAFWHHPPYTKGSHNSDTEGALIDMRVNALPILEDYGVDLVLSGHSHSYERSYLLDRHYGKSGTLISSMILDIGDGDKDSDGAYLKRDIIKDPNNGAVYVVAGSSGKTSGGTLNHPAMFASFNELGSVLLEVTNSELNAIFIDDDNNILDRFSIVKDIDTLAPTIVAAQAVDDTTVEVTFSERLDIGSAEATDNYVIDQDIVVSNAILSTDKRTVTLTTSMLAPAVSYTLAVNNVTDEAGNYIADYSQVTFTFVNLITVEFRNGALPDISYSGAEDAYLAQVSPDTNYGSSTELYLDGNDGNYVDLSSLLRFDISEIPSDAIIESAAIQIQVFNPSNSSYSVYELNKPWVEDEVTWNQYASTGTWGTVGALGVEDRESTVLASLSPPTGSYNINLNTDGVAMVQSWVDGGSTNHGVILGDTGSSDGVDFYSSEISVVANRPKLTVVYSLPVDSGDTQAPTVPTSLHSTSTGTDTVSLAWTASTDNVAVAGYKVYRDGDMVGNATGSSFVDSGLASATEYVYEVSAYDAAGNDSALSPPLHVTTDALVADMHISSIDMSIRTNKSKIRARAVVSVIDEFGAPVPGVTISADWSGVVNQSVSDITGTDGSITIDSANISRKTTGEFFVTVTDISAPDYNYTPASNAETSDCITTDGQSCGVLPAPTGLSAAYDGTEVSLNWSDVSLADEYKVYRSTPDNSGYVEIAAPEASAYVDTSVSVSSTYYYVVTALSGTDESGFSNEAIVDTTVSEPLFMHANNVTVSLKKKGSRYDATAVVSVVVGGSSTPVSGAMVFGNWSIAGTIVSGQGTTGADGKTSIKISRQSAKAGDVISFTVTGIERGNDTFDGKEITGSVTVQ